MNSLLFRLAALMAVMTLLSSGADDFAARCADRTAIERVYHSHRLGTTQPFEQDVPRALLEQMTALDQHKEAVLRKTYGVEITPAMVAVEVQRIETTTRAPEVLAEIKQALANDAVRFAAAMARPILVERELRHRFANDDKLHAPQRREAELARASLLAGKAVATLHDVKWLLTPHPAEDQPAPPSTPPAATQTSAKSSTYSNEATAQVSQAIKVPDKEAAAGKEKFYFEDLDPELQKVLRIQLQKPGDVSAVIETPAGFLLFVARERTSDTFAASSLTIAKRNCDAWLNEQSKAKP